MQISLRLFLLVFASVLVAAMLSGQRGEPQKPVSRDKPPAESQSAAQTAVATTDETADEDVDTEQLIPIPAPAKLPPAIRDSNIVPATHTATTEKSGFSNQELAQSVAFALRYAKLSSYEIDIDVRNGVVRLEGTVANPSQQTAAAQAARSVAGITRVVNRIRVSAGGKLAKPSDARPRKFPDIFAYELGRDVQAPEHSAGTTSDPPGSYLESSEAVARLLNGALAVTREVTLIGNTSIPDWVLRLELTTKVKTPWLSNGRFSAQNLDEDVSSLKQFYRNLGYFDVQVKQGTAISDDKSEARVKFVIDEGPRYSIRNIEFRGNESFSESQLRALLQMQPGDDYDQRVVDADKKKIAARYEKLGFKYARADPLTRSFEEPGAVDLVYEIAEFREKSGFAQSVDTRDVSGLTFSGVQSFDVAHICQALASDFDLICAARPETPLEKYLEILRKTIVEGYRHGGFPTATVETSILPASGQVQVRVHEGPRYRCGEVHVTGSQAVPAEVLVRALTADPKPAFRRWKAGSPVPFDDDSAVEMQKQLEAAFEDAGFYRPALDIRIDQQRDGGQADLTVTVYDPGASAVYGQINFGGLERNSPADVRKYLGVESGMPFNRRSTNALERHLAESGRFLSVRVGESDIANDAKSQRQTRDILITAREYDEAPPLAAPLAPAETAMLKLREWLQKWARGETDDDVVVDFQTPPDAVDPHIAVQMIVGPQRGQTISLQAIGPKGNTIFETAFAAYPDRLVLASLQRQAKLVLPNSSEDRLRLDIRGRGAKASDSDGRFRLELGTGRSTRSMPDPAPFEVRLDFSEVFMVGLAHEGKVQSTVRDGICRIGNKEFDLQVDTATGRPIEFRMLSDPDHPYCTIRARNNALRDELVRLEGPLAASVATYDSAFPWKSRLDFAVDELMFAIEQTKYAGDVDSLRALHKLVHLWSPPAVADLFATLPKPLPKGDDAFRLPTQRGGWSSGTALEAGSKARKLLISNLLLPVFRQFVPAAGDVWPVGRDLILDLGNGDATRVDSLWNSRSSAEMNPRSMLLLQLLDEHVNSLFKAFVPRESLQCLELAAIGDGCEAFLAGDSWSSRWLLSVAAALRGLDESELTCILDLLSNDATFREALMECLAVLRKSPEAPLKEILPAAIDRFWTSVFQTEPPNGSGSVGGQLLPAAYYSKDDLQYFAPAPEFKLMQQVRAIEERKKRDANQQP